MGDDDAAEATPRDCIESFLRALERPDGRLFVNGETWSHSFGDAKRHIADAVRRSLVLEWRHISTVPDDDEAWIVVRTGPNSVAPGHVMRCRRGMLSDRPGPNHLRLFADYWMPYVDPED